MDVPGVYPLPQFGASRTDTVPAPLGSTDVDRMAHVGPPPRQVAGSHRHTPSGEITHSPGYPQVLHDPHTPHAPGGGGVGVGPPGMIGGDTGSPAMTMDGSASWTEWQSPVSSTSSFSNQ
jgi:hypothetical protein